MLKNLSKHHKIQVGDPAPNFTLPSASGETVHLHDFLGKSNVILYFYPKDNTYACTVESVSFRDNYDDFVKADAVVIGVSSDSPKSHAQFAGKFNLPFQLLSDQKNSVRKLYGVPPTFKVIPGRVTYVIDKKGIVRYIFSSQFSPRSHVEHALDALKEIELIVTT